VGTGEGTRGRMSEAGGGHSRLATAVLVALAALVLAGAIVSPGVIPYDMDEFAHYQPLACAAFPLSREHNLRRESCGEYDLRLPFTGRFLPLRSYLYIGSLPVLPFYPFWRVVQDPVAARIQGAVFFLLSGLLVARIVGVPPFCGVLAGLIVPASAFSFLVDTGPVGISVLLLLSAVRLLQGLPEARHPGLRAALAGAVVFLGILVKPVFLWTLPALGLFALLRAPARESRGRVAAAGLAAFLVPLLLLAFAQDRDGDRYFEILRLGGVSNASGSVQNVLARVFAYLFRGSDILPRSLAVPFSAADLVPPLILLGLLGHGLRRGSRKDGALFILLALLTLAATVFTGSAYWPHHFAFTGTFLVLGLAAFFGDLSPRLQILILALVLAFGIGLVARLPLATQSPEANRAKDELLEFIRARELDRKTVEVHTSWGTFYISHLFGARDQEVLFFRLREWTESRAHLAEVRSLAESERRGILVLTSRPESLTHTPLVETTLGPPVARYTFGNWEALEYLR
jgi:hypothetical protein